MDSDTPVITAKGLTKRFKGPDGQPLDALKNVDLTINAHKITALVGADGAGKTTFMRMAAGLMAPTSGSLTVIGLDEARSPAVIQERISYMPQRFGLYEDLSVRENMDLYANLHGVTGSAREERYKRLLKMTDLERFTERPAGKLSGGMKQKLGLACTLVRSPELLLLDEPSVGVDPLSRVELWEIVSELVKTEHLSVVWATSYMDEAAKCDEVAVMHEGRLLSHGVPRDFIESVRGRTYYTSPEPGVPARLLQAKLFDDPEDIYDAVPEGGEVKFVTKPGADIASLEKKFGRPIRPREPDFEDFFMVTLREHGAIAESLTGRAPEEPAAAPKDGKPVIRVENLVRKFGDFTAVASTSFNVGKGEIFGLLGPNGAGKTTTFRMLCGLLPATSGTLEVAGLNLRTARAQARAHIGYVAQKFSLYGTLTIQENLEFFAGAYGLSGGKREKQVRAAMEEFGLEPDAVAGIVPMGYKRRLSIAAALMHEPQILFLDEPTSGLDPIARRFFWRVITRLCQKGVTVIVTTHFMEEAEYCDRMAIQDAGKLLALGAPKEVRTQGGSACKDMNEAFIAIVKNNRAQKTGAVQGGAS